MTGDAPQPPDPPRDDHGGTSWWHNPADRDAAPAAGAEQLGQELAGAASPRPRRARRRPPPEVTASPPATAPPAAFAPEALDAHAAGAQDTTTAFETPPAVRLEAELHDRIEQVEEAAAARTVADTRDDDRPAPPVSPVDGVPDVMVLPEPGPNRPTVVLGPRPARTPSQADQAALEASRWRMENHPFWLSDEQRAAEPTVEAPPPTAGTVPAGVPARPRGPRRPATGLLGLVALALVAAFFAWVSAEPFWLAVGHGDHGTATVDACTGSGVTQRCVGTFAAADGGFTVHRVALLGVSAEDRATGTAAAARMVAADSRQAYLGGAGALMHLRWVLGFVLVVLCGYGIAGMTGARHLDTPRSRRNAVLISVAGPVLLLVGFLVAAY